MEWQCLVIYSSAFFVLTWFAVYADANGLLSAHYIKAQAKLAAVNGAVATMREAYEILSNPDTPLFIKVAPHSELSFNGSTKQNIHYVQSLYHVRFGSANFE